MARDYLTQAQKDVLHRATRRATLSVALGDGTPLYFSSGDGLVENVVYTGRLAPVDALNLELTAAVEGIKLKISNITLALGRNLINTPDILAGTAAVLGAYFFDSETGASWHDEKVSGEIQVGDIDGDWVGVFFTSKADSVEYGGVSIVSLFPEPPAPPAPAVQPVYNDLGNHRDGSGGGGISPFSNDYRRDGRYILPYFA